MIINIRTTPGNNSSINFEFVDFDWDQMTTKILGINNDTNFVKLLT